MMHLPGFPSVDTFIITADLLMVSNEDKNGLVQRKGSFWGKFVLVLFHGWVYLTKPLFYAIHKQSFV